MKRVGALTFLLLVVGVIFAQERTDTKAYKIGDIGPGGGVVFHIDGDTYLECSELLGKAEWTDAKTLAKSYRGGGYDDWYLPNKTELNYIYVNLRAKGFESGDNVFWSSSHGTGGGAWDQRFSDGIQYNDFKGTSLGVRAVRAFSLATDPVVHLSESELIPYKIGDKGPGGGVVFHIDGDTYLESRNLLVKAPLSNAIILAETYRGGGYDDWYVPTKEELNYIYENLRAKGFESGNDAFWSSSEQSDRDAWAQRFSDGYQYDRYTWTSLGVRVVRAFTLATAKGHIRIVHLPESELISYKIGDIGPGGGLVFHIDGDTYLECSNDLGEATWDDAMQMAEDYQGGRYDDWYLPNKDELNYIYENLRVQNIISDTGWFWSSSEYDNLNAWGQHFFYGVQSNYDKTFKFNVRAIRAFTLITDNGTIRIVPFIDPELIPYKIGDKGPGGGLVFHVDKDTYLECSDDLGIATWDDAMQMATDYRGGGYDDWYLPNKDELNYIYENLAVQGFIPDYGWLCSSSELSNNADYAWYQNIYSGAPLALEKTATPYVRVIRAFNY